MNNVSKVLLWVAIGVGSAGILTAGFFGGRRIYRKIQQRKTSQQTNESEK